MHLSVSTVLRAFAEKIQADIDEENVDDACYHGGQSWEISKFDTFDVRDGLIVADHCWTANSLPPCPEALEIIGSLASSAALKNHLQHNARIYPHRDHCRSQEVVPSRHVAVSSGSSSLMFSLLPRLLNEDSSPFLFSRQCTANTATFCNVSGLPHHLLCA